MSKPSNLLNGILPDHEIDAPEDVLNGVRTPYNKEHFASIGILNI
jgi:hypothetical protein